MTRRPVPRRLTVDGEEVVVLDVQTFEHLDAERRRAGAQSTRIAMLKDQLRKAQGLLEDVERLARTLTGCSRVTPEFDEHGVACCPRHAFAVVLAREIANDT